MREKGCYFEKEEVTTQNRELPPQFEIKHYKPIVEELFFLFPPNIRNFLKEEISRLEYPSFSRSDGDGLVDEQKRVTIGVCLDPLYFSELFLHELDHAIVDWFIEKDPVLLSQYREGIEKLRKKNGGPYEDIAVEHIAIQALPLYVLHPKAVEKLEESFEGWKIIFSLYRELLGPISRNKEKREKIKKLIQSEREKEEEKWSKAGLLEEFDKIRKKFRNGYLFQDKNLREIKDYLSNY